MGRGEILHLDGTPTTFPRQAALTHALYATDPNRPVEIWANEEDRLVRWLSKRLNFPLHAPNLHAMGYDLVGGRLVAGNEKPGALFIYENADKQRISLLVRKDNEHTSESAFRYALEDGVGVFYWIDDACGYALSGRVDKAQLLAIARVVRVEIKDHYLTLATAKDERFAFAFEDVLGFKLAPRRPFDPTDAMRAMAAGGFHYVLYFQTPGVAEAELERDVERSLRAFYQDPVNIDPAEMRKAPPGVFGEAGGGLLDRFSDHPHGKFLTEQDFQTFVKAFKKSGFRGGLNWYRCIDRSWQESLGQTDRVEQPALMITAELDFVLWPEQTLGMERWVPNLKRANILGSGHWTQQEKPAEVNAALLEFLSDLR